MLMDGLIASKLPHDQMNLKYIGGKESLIQVYETRRYNVVVVSVVVVV
jgi:hypothetical protein